MLLQIHDNPFISHCRIFWYSESNLWLQDPWSPLAIPCELVLIKPLLVYYLSHKASPSFPSPFFQALCCLHFLSNDYQLVVNLHYWPFLLLQVPLWSILPHWFNKARSTTPLYPYFDLQRFLLPGYRLWFQIWYLLQNYAQFCRSSWCEFSSNVASSRLWSSFDGSKWGLPALLRPSSWARTSQNTLARTGWKNWCCYKDYHSQIWARSQPILAPHLFSAGAIQRSFKYLCAHPGVCWDSQVYDGQDQRSKHQFL